MGNYEQQSPVSYWRNRAERAEVQLAGCSTAAMGATRDDQIAKPGNYGWSMPYQEVLDLRKKYDELILPRPVTWKEELYGNDYYAWVCSGCGVKSRWMISPNNIEIKYCFHCGHPIAAFDPYTPHPPADTDLPSEGGK